MANPPPTPATNVTFDLGPIIAGLLGRHDYGEENNKLLKQLLEGVQKIMDAFSQLQTDVAANTDVVESALVLINGFSAKLDAALAKAGAERDAALAELSASLKTEDQKLADAVAANTTAAP